MEISSVDFVVARRGTQRALLIPARASRGTPHSVRAIGGSLIWQTADGQVESLGGLTALPEEAVDEFMSDEGLLVIEVDSAGEAVRDFQITARRRFNRDADAATSKATQ